MRKKYLKDGELVAGTEIVLAWNAKQKAFEVDALNYAEDYEYGARVCIDEKGAYVLKDGTESDELEFVEDMLIKMFSKIGTDLPENFENIAKFVYEDIKETADPEGWHEGDVMIGFRRYIEAKLRED